jgi:hypothetical protein
MAYKTFVNGFAFNASDVNAFLMNQSVITFANATERSSTLTTPVEGMVTYLVSTKSYDFWNGTAWTALVSVPTGVAINRAVLTSPQEPATVTATAATGTIQFDVITQSDLFYTTNASANFTLNVRGNSSTALNTILGTNTSQTIVFRNTNGATPFYLTGLSIDGTNQTIRWQGGTAPAAGNASSIDVYVFQITKTAANTYTVLGSLTRFA